jgi:hypothetical protein
MALVAGKAAAGHKHAGRTGQRPVFRTRTRGSAFLQVQAIDLALLPEECGKNALLPSG